MSSFSATIDLADQAPLGQIHAEFVVDTTSGTEVARLENVFPFDLDVTGERILVKSSEPYPTNEQITTTWKVLSVADGRTLIEFGAHGATSYGASGETDEVLASQGLDIETVTEKIGNR